MIKVKFDGMLSSIHNYKETFQFGKEWSKNNKGSFLIILATSGAFVAIAWIYRRLQQPDILPFDQWYISLGFFNRRPLNSQDLQKINNNELKALCDRDSPAELTSRLLASIQHHPKNFTDDKIRAYLDEKKPLSEKAFHILPSYQESSLLFLEEEKALAMQSWATRLQQWLALMGLHTTKLGENLLETIQSYPHLSYTILFNFAAPYAAQKIWEGIRENWKKDYLPSSLYESVNEYLQHKGKIAVGCFCLITALYYIMRQEKGILTNLTENWATFHGAHRGLDLIKSNEIGIHEIFCTVGKTAPGAHGSNIIWYYNPESHSSCGEGIGEALAETTATGRVYTNKRPSTNFPRLKNLQIFRLDLEAFLISYQDIKAVYQGWNETLNFISKNGNVLVVLEGLSKLQPYLAPSSAGPKEEGPMNFHLQRSMSTEKILASLLTHSLKQGRLRCLISLSLYDKEQLEKNKAFFRFFTAIRAPDLNPEEIQEHSLLLYTSPNASYAFSKDDIEDLFSRMRSSLTVVPRPPYEITSLIEETMKTRELSWRKIPNQHFSGDQKAHTQKIEKAERRLKEAQQLKNQMLQKVWQLRRLDKPVSTPLLQAVTLLQEVLLPIYVEDVLQKKNEFQSTTPQQELLSTMQRHFKQFFGPCSPEEKDKLKNLKEDLKNAGIVGQDRALETICNTIILHRRVPPLDGKPLVLFLAGPPASGKSVTATKLAKQLKSIYGISDISTEESNVKRINLNRAQQGGVSGWEKIKSSILGYIRQVPTSIIILEEWDKMDPADKSSLIDLLEGTPDYYKSSFPWFESNENGPLVEKRCATFIITSNIASNHLSPYSELPTQSDRAEAPSSKLRGKGVGAEIPDAEEEKFLRPEEVIRNEILACSPESSQAFISRIDKIVPYVGVSSEDIDKLCNDYLKDYINQKVLPEKLMDEAKAEILKISSPEERKDVRQLQRIIREAILKVLDKSNL